MMGRLNDLGALGQAVWLDYLDRRFVREGALAKLVDEDGLTGVTSNPSIFEQAMAHGTAYDDGLAAFDRAHAGAAAIDRYEAMAVEDIRAAADILRPVYDRLDGRDGFVSLEVSPYVADDTDATIAEAARLWKRVDKPNLMVKIPGTNAGIPAVAASIAAGINVNVTLLFSLDSYRRVAEAYAEGLEQRVARGQPIDRIASVASFFVSRIDARMDKKIDALDTVGARALRGGIAIANAKMAYRWYLGFLGSDRWQALAAMGAQPQRLLWASTGTKDPAYSDVLYVDALIGPDTVNTMPMATLDAFRDHGTARLTLTEDVESAVHVVAEADRLGLDLAGVTEALAQEGIVAFARSFDNLLAAIAARHPAVT